MVLSNLQSGVKSVGGEVLGVGRNLWLAGLGVVAVVGEGTKDRFESLVVKGQDFSKKKGGSVKNVKSWVSDVEKRAQKTGSKVETVIQKQVESGLHLIGIPTRNEIRTLIDRVEKLSDQVEQIKN